MYYLSRYNCLRAEKEKTTGEPAQQVKSKLVGMELRLAYYKVRLELSDDELAQSGEVGIQNGKDGTEYSFIMAHKSRVTPRIVHQKSG